MTFTRRLPLGSVFSALIPVAAVATVVLVAQLRWAFHHQGSVDLPLRFGVTGVLGVILGFCYAGVLARLVRRAAPAQAEALTARLWAAHWPALGLWLYVFHLGYRGYSLNRILPLFVVTIFLVTLLEALRIVSLKDQIRRAWIGLAPRLSVGTCADGMLLALFLILICLPLVAGVQTVGTEKRKLAAAPPLEFGKLPDFPKKFDAYFNDHFGFRGKLVLLNSLVKVRLFGLSPVATVIVGKEGWLFYLSEKRGDGETIRDYRGLVTYAPEKLETLTVQLQQRVAWFEDRGIGLVMIVCPNKEMIYPEYLPDSITRVKATTRLDQVMSQLRSYPDIPLVDPREALLAMKPRWPIYYKTDTHWNSLGGFVAYSEIMSRLEKRRPSLKPLALADFELTIAPRPGGGLADMLALQDWMTDLEVTLKPQAVTPPRKKLGKLLVFGDSFRYAMIPFLEHHFEQVVLREGRFDAGVVERDKPDVVIIEMVERYQQRLVK